MKTIIEDKTDWARVLREAAEDAPIPYDPEDGPYDPNDEAATEAYLTESLAIKRKRGERGPQKSPTKQRITIALSPDVLEHYRATGKGWQARIDADLRSSIQKAG